MKKISIVIPAYNEQNNIAALYKEIQNTLKNNEFECIFIDDGSTDNTFDEIKKLSEHNKQVKGISFSRNFGHQIALFAGLKETSGDVVIMLDADGQHPPRLIPELIKKHKEGFDIVNTKRISTENTSFTKKITSKLYYFIINSLADIKIENASSDFRLMNRKATDAFLKIEEKDRFTRGLVSWIGFKQTVIEYQAPKRSFGKSKYTFRKMLRLAWDGITSFSSRPLKLSFYIGIFSLIFGVLYSFYALMAHFSGKTIQGWTSTIIIILLLGGFQLLSIGIIGEYLSRIFNEAKNRPHYFIKDRC